MSPIIVKLFSTGESYHDQTQYLLAAGDMNDRLSLFDISQQALNAAERFAAGFRKVDEIVFCVSPTGMDFAVLMAAFQGAVAGFKIAMRPGVELTLKVWQQEELQYRTIVPFLLQK